MMKRNLILLVIFIILASIVYFMEFAPQPKRAAVEETNFFVGFNSDKVARIEIKSLFRTNILQRDGDKWLVGEESNLPTQKEEEGDKADTEPTPTPTPEMFLADIEQVEKLLDTVAELPKGELVSKNRDKHQQFELTGFKGTEVILYDEHEKPLAHFNIGKNGPDFLSTYVKKAGSDNVYLVQGYIKHIFDKGGLDGWRDKTIFDFDQAKLASLTIEDYIIPTPPPKDEKKGEKKPPKLSDKPVNTTTIIRQNDSWSIAEQADLNLDIAKIEQTVKTLASLKAQGFARKPDAEHYDFSKPQYVFIAQMDDGTEHRLLVGGDRRGYQFFVKKQGDEQILTINKHVMEQLTRKAEDYVLASAGEPASKPE